MTKETTLTGSGKYLGYFQSLVGSRIYLSLALSVVITLFDSVGIGLLVAILQFMANSENGDSSLSLNAYYKQVFGQDATFLMLILIAIFIFLLKGLLTFTLYSVQARMTTTIISKTRHNILDSIVNLNFASFTKTDLGTIQNISTSEVGRLNIALNSYLKTGQYLIMSVVYLALAIVFDPVFSFLIIFTALAVLYLYNFIIKYFKKLSRQILSSRNQYSSFLTQLLTNYKYLKTTDTIDKYSRKVKDQIDHTESLNYRFLKINAITDSAREPIILVMISLAIILLFHVKGGIGISMIFTMLLFYRTLNNVLLIQANWQGFHQNSGSVDRIISIQEEFSKDMEAIGTDSAFHIAGRISLEKVDLNLSDKQILSDISLTLEKNSTTALVGPSGAGKTTLASVITGLIQPNSGNISINNRLLESSDLKGYRRKIGFVTQDPVIFNDTLFNNITLWEEKNSQSVKRFSEICRMTHLEDFVQAQLDKEDMQLGDFGITLSGGQKQRISIARELYRDVELLVFDEATSSLDAITEQIILENIQSIRGKVTIILIAHRLSTIRFADRIYFIEGGRITASGTYDELMQTSPDFLKMVNLQSG